MHIESLNSTHFKINGIELPRGYMLKFDEKWIYLVHFETQIKDEGYLGSLETTSVNGTFYSTFAALNAAAADILYNVEGAESGINNYNSNNAFEQGTVVIKDDKFFMSNDVIPADTPFVIGETGATWREISKPNNKGLNFLGHVATHADLPTSNNTLYDAYEVDATTGRLLTFNLKRKGRWWWDGTKWTTRKLPTELITEKEHGAPSHNDLRPHYEGNLIYYSGYLQRCKADIPAKAFLQSDWDIIPNSSVPRWKSNTDGGVYGNKDVINFDGVLYVNKTGTNTDTHPRSDEDNWRRADQNLGVTLSIGGGVLIRHNFPSVSWNLGVDEDGDDAFYSDNPAFRMIQPTSGNDAGVLQLRATATGTAGEKRITVPEITHLRILPNGTFDFTRVITDTFSTEWQSDTDGGSYSTDAIVIHGGVFYKNKVGNNTDVTPDLDGTNWEVYGSGGPEYMVAKYSSSSFSISNGMTFPYDTVLDSEGSSISNSSGVFTLQAGKTYKLTADIGRFAGTGYVAWRWYNNTTNSWLDTSSTAQQWGSNYGASYTDSGSAFAIITPTVDTAVRLRQSSGTTSATQSTEGTYGTARVFIEVMK